MADLGADLVHSVDSLYLIGLPSRPVTLGPPPLISHSRSATLRPLLYLRHFWSATLDPTLGQQDMT